MLQNPLVVLTNPPFTAMSFNCRTMVQKKLKKTSLIRVNVASENTNLDNEMGIASVKASIISTVATYYALVHNYKVLCAIVASLSHFPFKLNGAPKKGPRNSAFTQVFAQITPKNCLKFMFMPSLPNYAGCQIDLTK